MDKKRKVLGLVLLSMGVSLLISLFISNETIRIIVGIGVIILGYTNFQ